MRRKGKAGKMEDDHKTLCGILFEYLAKIKMSLPDGMNTQECCYKWRNKVVPGRDILEAFENYLERKLTREFESCRDRIEATMKINIAEKISKLKFSSKRFQVFCKFCLFSECHSTRYVVLNL